MKRESPPSTAVQVLFNSQLEASVPWCEHICQRLQDLTAYQESDDVEIHFYFENGDIPLTGSNQPRSKRRELPPLQAEAVFVSD